MKAFVAAAGLGTRLGKITKDKPKALAVVGGKTEIQIVFEQLKKYGFTEVVVNLHHFADKVKQYLAQNQGFGLQVSFSDETDLLRDTGGGLKYARKILEDVEVFLVHNVDVLSDINIGELLSFHQNENALATLAVRSRNTSRYLMANAQNQMCGWQNIKTGATKPAQLNTQNLNMYAFSGITALSPRLFDLMEDTDVFSIIDTYVRLCTTEKIMLYPHNYGYWMDMGRPENIPKAEEIMRTKY